MAPIIHHNPIEKLPPWFDKFDFDEEIDLSGTNIGLLRIIDLITEKKIAKITY